MILGDRATDYLLDLWLSVAMERPDGNLAGLDAMDIAIMAGWGSDPMTLVNALVEVGFLDVTTVERTLNDVTTNVTTNSYSLHDWAEHNGYACAANDRSGKSRFSRMAKTHPVLYARLKAQGKESISSEEFRQLTALNERLTTVERPLTNRSSPSPSPSPSLNNDDNAGARSIPAEAVKSAYNKFCPSLVPARELSPSSTRHLLLRAIWAKYKDHDGGPLLFLDTLFKRAEASDTLTNRNGQWRGHPCNLDWLLKEENYINVIEGRYDNGRQRKTERTTAKPGTLDDDLTREFLAHGGS